MEMIYRHFATSKSDTDPPEARTHTLTFREPPPEPTADSPTMLTGSLSVLTLVLTEAQAQAFVLGVTYNLVLGQAAKSA